MTDAGGSREAVLHEQTGLVVPLSDPQTLADAYKRLISDDAFRNQLGETGKTRAQAEFTREIMVEKIVRIYDQVL